MIKNALILMGEIGGNDYNYVFFVGKTIEEVREFVPLVISTISSAITVTLMTSSNSCSASLWNTKSTVFLFCFCDWTSKA